MAFNNYETSRERGQPVELYKFVYGTQADEVTPLFHAYTDGESPVTHDGIVYEPLPGLIRTDLKVKGKIAASEIRVTVPLTSLISDLFRIYPPSFVVTLTLRQGHIPDARTPTEWALGENFPVAWLGRVLEGNREGAETVLTCEAASVSMKRPGLRRNYQWPCPLALYGSRCQADKANATTEVIAVTTSGNRVTVQDLLIPQVDADPDNDPGGVQVDAYAPGAYVGGLVEWIGDLGRERRSILRVENDLTLVLTGPTRDLNPTDVLFVSLGCPHTLEGCGKLHNNVVNYGGQPFIPTFNPINKNNHT
jgi:hypothetical protein